MKSEKFKFSRSCLERVAFGRESSSSLKQLFKFALYTFKFEII